MYYKALLFAPAICLISPSYAESEDEDTDSIIDDITADDNDSASDDDEDDSTNEDSSGLDEITNVETLILHMKAYVEVAAELLNGIQDGNSPDEVAKAFNTMIEKFEELSDVATDLTVSEEEKNQLDKMMKDLRKSVNQLNKSITIVSSLEIESEALDTAICEFGKALNSILPKLDISSE